MTLHYKEHCIDLSKISMFILIMLVFLTIACVGIRQRRVAKYQQAPCCLKGHICKAMMRITD